MADKKGPWERLGNTRFDRVATAADAALSGYQAGQTEGYADDALGLVVSAATGGPVGAAIFAVSSIFGRRKRKKERREQQLLAARRVIDLQPRDSVPLPFVYGRFRRDCVGVFAAVGDDLPAHATAYQTVGNRHMFGRINGYEGTGAFAGYAGGTGRSAFLLCQSDIAAGHVSEVYDVLFRGRSLLNDTTLRKYAFARLGVPGQADQMATIFQTTNRDLQRDANSKFVGKSYLTHVHYQWYGDPQWDEEVPLPEVIGFGAYVKTITATGESTTLTRTSNPVRIAFDWLRQRQGVPLSGFRLQKWYDAQQGITDLSGIDARADAHPPKPVVRDGDVYVDDDSGESELELFRRYGFVEDSGTVIGTGLDTRTVLGAHQAPTLRYEFDGEIRSELPIEEQVDAILESIPGVVYYRDHEQKLAISLPDSDTAVETQSKGTLDESVVLDLVDYGPPLEEDKVSSLTVRFFDVNQDLREASEVFPRPGSTLETQLKAIEGDLIRGELDLEGICNPYLAHSAAVNYMLMSHRNTGQVVCNPHAFKYEPGDIVRLKLKKEELDEYVRILDRTENSDRLAITYDVMQFNKGDYAYVPDSKKAVTLPAAPDLSLAAPTNVVATRIEDDAQITWEGGNSNTASYEIEMQYGATAVIRALAGWVAIGEVSVISAKSFVQSLFTGEYSYRFRVRSKGHDGGVSAFAMSPVYTFKRTVPVPEENFLDKPAPPVLVGKDQSIEATWTMLAGVAYQLEFKTLAATWPTPANDAKTFTPATSPHLQTMLTNGTAYVARIRKAIDAADSESRKSDWSDDSNAATPSGLLIPDLTLTPITSTASLDKVLATWTASPGATKYCLQTRLAGQLNITDKVRVEDGTSTTLGRHWSVGSRYEVRVEAVDETRSIVDENGTTTHPSSGWSEWVAHRRSREVRDAQAGRPARRRPSHRAKHRQLQRGLRRPHLGRQGA